MRVGVFLRFSSLSFNYLASLPLISFFWSLPVSGPAAAAAAAAESTTSCDACQFVSTDPADCKVYGQLGDGVIIGWNKAGQDCLKIHNIKVESVNPTTLQSMFPNPDGSDGNVNAFVNYLRFQEGDAAVTGIRLSLTSFFTEGTTPGSAVLKDTITVDGVTYDCKASASDCWNKGLKTYFQKEPGATEMQKIGADLYNRQKLDREVEQSTVRIAICNDEMKDSSTICEPLKAQIETKKKENPNKACSAFGLGPAHNAIPGCTSSKDGGNTSTGKKKEGTTTSSAATVKGAITEHWSSMFGSIILLVMAMAGL